MRPPRWHPKLEEHSYELHLESAVPVSGFLLQEHPNTHNEAGKYKRSALRTTTKPVTKGQNNGTKMGDYEIISKSLTLTFTNITVLCVARRVLLRGSMATSIFFLLRHGVSDALGMWQILRR